MSYVNRRTVKKRSGTAELTYLFIVLAAAFATAWWAAHMVAMDLSSVSAMASVLGLTETGRLTHGAAGYQANDEVQQARPDQAPYCSAGQTPTFAVALADLQQQLGDVMGSPAECAHPASPSPVADTIQLTTTGLVAYNMLTDTVSFTDGWRHWAVTPGGVVAWEGTDSNPPPG